MHFNEFLREGLRGERSLERADGRKGEKTARSLCQLVKADLWKEAGGGQQGVNSKVNEVAS